MRPSPYAVRRLLGNRLSLPLPLGSTAHYPCRMIPNGRVCSRHGFVRGDRWEWYATQGEALSCARAYARTLPAGSTIGIYWESHIIDRDRKPHHAPSFPLCGEFTAYIATGTGSRTHA